MRCDRAPAFFLFSKQAATTDGNFRAVFQYPGNTFTRMCLHIIGNGYVARATATACGSNNCVSYRMF